MTASDTSQPSRNPDDLDALVGQWLTVPQVADRLGTAEANVRGAFDQRRIVGARPASHRGFKVPADFLVPAHLANAADPGPAPAPGHERDVILPSLQGTVMLLGDMGLSDDEILRWLFTVEETLGVTPIAALRAGNKSAVRRAAQLLT